MKIWPLILTAVITTVESRDCTGKHSYHGRHDHTQARFKNGDSDVGDIVKLVTL